MSEAVIYDTKRIQIVTLCSYMQEKHEANFCGDGFVNVTGLGKFEMISFNKAVALFNNDPKTKVEFGTSSLKLSYSKKSKKIICTDHLLKFQEDLVEGEDGLKNIINGLKNIASGKKA